MNPPHSSSYHDFSDDEIHSLRTKLTEWYNSNRRKLPWRGDPPPYGNDAKMSEPPHKKRKISSYFETKPNAKNTNAKKKKEEINISKSKLKISPYHIWISEVMLQQTKVATVIDYWIKWMNAFPTVHALSKATLDEVNAVWAGLGYYRRAKFIHEASKQIINEFGGTLPASIKELKSIKGIGDYTAGAISSIGYNECNAAVDGNVVRVLSRLRAIACPASPPLSIHWKLASELVKNSQNASILNQSLMELGATICKPKNPNCESCPISDHCKAIKEEKSKKRPFGDDVDCKGSECLICGDLPIDDIEELSASMFPLKKKKNKMREQVVVSGIIIMNGNVLMIKRPKNGLLANQWEFPSHILFESKPKMIKNKKMNKMFSEKAMFDAMLQKMNSLFYEDIIDEMIIKHEFIGYSMHTFSHILQKCNIFRIYLDGDKVEKKLNFDGDYEWYSMQSVKSKKLTMCVKKQWLIHERFGQKKTFKQSKLMSGNKRKRSEIELD